jgi:hypothetical protein
VVIFLSFSRFPELQLAHKLKSLKVDLRVWNKQMFGNVENQKKNPLEELSVLDGLEEEIVLYDEEKLRKYIVIGACGGNTTIDSSRTKKEPLRSSFLFSFIICTLRQLRSLPL